MATVGKWPALREDEKAAARYLVNALEEALARMAEISERAMLSRQERITREFLHRWRTSLAKLADEYSLGIAEGDYGQHLVGLMERGAAAVPGAGIGNLPTAAVEAVLSNVSVDIKDILETGVKLVHREVLSVVVAGKSLREVSDAIYERLALAEGGVMTRRRAELIAHSETHSVYRQAQVATGTEMGFECFRMVGPRDSRTEPICERHLGEVHTPEEWDAIKDTWRTYGLHYGCRHGWIPATCPGK